MCAGSHFFRERLTRSLTPRRMIARSLTDGPPELVIVPYRSPVYRTLRAPRSASFPLARGSSMDGALGGLLPRRCSPWKAPRRRPIPLDRPDGGSPIDPRHRKLIPPQPAGISPPFRELPDVARGRSLPHRLPPFQCRASSATGRALNPWSPPACDLIRCTSPDAQHLPPPASRSALPRYPSPSPVPDDGYHLAPARSDRFR